MIYSPLPMIAAANAMRRISMEMNMEDDENDVYDTGSYHDIPHEKEDLVFKIIKFPFRLCITLLGLLMYPFILFLGLFSYSNCKEYKREMNEWFDTILDFTMDSFKG